MWAALQAAPTPEQMSQSRISAAAQLKPCRHDSCMPLHQMLTIYIVI